MSRELRNYPEAEYVSACTLVLRKIGRVGARNANEGGDSSNFVKVQNAEENVEKSECSSQKRSAVLANDQLSALCLLRIEFNSSLRFLHCILAFFSKHTNALIRAVDKFDHELNEIKCIVIRGETLNY